MPARSVISITAFLMAALAGVAHAQDIPRLNLIIGFSPGGNYDATGRLYARHFNRFLPGNPVVIVQNMPGAGSVQATNHIYNIAPKDGSMLAIVDGAILFQALFGNPSAKYDPRQITWIGGRAPEFPQCAIMKADLPKSIEDARQKEYVLGAAVGTRTVNHPRMLNALIGTKFRLVTGFPGGAEITQAMEKGEVDGWCGWSWGSIKRRQISWLKEGRMVLLLQTALRKSPDLPDVPLALDFAKSDADRSVMQVAMADTEIATPMIGPPGMSPERVAQLRKSFEAMLADKDLLADANKVGIDIDPVSGETMRKTVEQIFALPPEIIERAKAINQ